MGKVDESPDGVDETHDEDRWSNEFVSSETIHRQANRLRQEGHPFFSGRIREALAQTLKPGEIESIDD